LSRYFILSRDFVLSPAFRRPSEISFVVHNYYVRKRGRLKAGLKISAA
jgi:hypothetical protein